MDKNSPTKQNNLPITIHHSPIHHSTNHHSPLTTHSSPHHSPLTSFTFISDNPELNAAVSRYFKYVRREKIVTLSPTSCPSPITNHHSTNLPITNHQSPIFVIHNEVFVDNNLLSIFPLWFHWGAKNNKKVYCFTQEPTDLSNNILNWQDFLKPGALNHFHKDIDYRKIPYFEETAGVLRRILKPHGGDSLYDLSAKLHTTFANLPQRITRTKITTEALTKIKTDFIDKGIQLFSQFQQKVKRYRLFLSYLPDSPALYSSISRLENLIEQLRETDFIIRNVLENISKILDRLKSEVIYIYNFLKSLEILLSAEMA